MSEFSSDDQKKAYVAGLVEELRGYTDRGDDDSAAQVRAELARVTGEARQPRKRAEKRPSGRAGAEKR